MASDILDLTSYDGDTSNFVTQGGVPIVDIGMNVNGGNTNNANTQGILVDGGSFASLQPDAPREVIYGKFRTGGNITFFTTDQYQVGQYVWLVSTLAGHQIDSIEGLYLDGKLVTFPGPIYGGWANGDFTNLVFLSLSEGTEGQNANGDLLGQANAHFPTLWSAEHRQRGWAYAFLILKYDPAIYTNSVPKLQFVVKGKKVYDPRDPSQNVYDPETWEWSDNAALCIVDYMCNPVFGGGIDYFTKINEANFIEAANICDELVGVVGGGTEKRYTCNGKIITSSVVSDVLGQMLTSIGGSDTLSKVGAEYFLYPKKWKEPVLTITEDDIVSSIRIRIKQSRRDTYNGVIGTFVDPNQDWQQVDFPPVNNSTYLTWDQNRVNQANIQLPFCTSNAQAQRLAKIILEESRQGGFVEFEAKMRMLQLVPNDNVYLDLPRFFGEQPKIYKVGAMGLSVGGGGSGETPAVAVGMSLKETAEGVTDWADGAETTIDLAPDTYLPNPTLVQSPVLNTPESGTDQLLKLLDGSIVPRVLLTWTNVDPYAVKTEIEFRLTGDANWTPTAYATNGATQTYIAGVQDGLEYDFRIRNLNSANFASPWVVFGAHLVLGKDELPSDVVTMTGEVLSYGIRIRWPHIGDIDRKDYILRYGGSTYSNSPNEVITDSTEYIFPITSVGVYNFFIKARDTSNNLSFLPNGVVVTISKPLTPTLMSEFVGENVRFTWGEVTGSFAVIGYRLSMGSDFLTRTEIVTTKATSFIRKVDWLGSETFWLEALDVSSNVSDPFQKDVIVTPPGVVANLTYQQIDNFVNLRWVAPSAGSLPIAGYDIYGGDDFNTAVLLGTEVGTFHSEFKTEAGNYRFWIVPRDSAGNAGTELYTDVPFTAPRDYILHGDELITSFDTYSDIIPDGGGFIGPLDDSRTWQQHFTDGGYTTIQDIIDDGYSILAQPGSLTGYAEKIIDFGAIVPSATIRALWDFTQLTGDAAISVELSYSDDNVTYSTPEAGPSIPGTNFQYVKVRFKLDASDDEGIGFFKNPRIILSVRKDYDSGLVTVSASGAGTIVPFNVSFFSIITMAVSPRGNSKLIAEWDVADGPNPTEFTLYLWNRSDGSAAAGEVGWTAEGVVG